MISLKMEIPEDAWSEDPSGIMLANYVNANLPCNIKVFSILPSQGSGIYTYDLVNSVFSNTNIEIFL